MALMDEIYRSEELICKGLHEINDRGELDDRDLERMGELIDAAKDYYEMTMKAEYEDGYAEGYSRGYSNGSNNQSYNQSYARRRDSRGRYTSYGRDYMRGHDNVNDEMISMLEEKMNHAATEEERERYRRKIIEIENGR